MHSDEDEIQRKSAKYMQGSLVIRLLLCLVSFITGSLAQYEQSLGLFFVFTVVNGVLGGFIFFSHCTCNQKVRKKLVQKNFEWKFNFFFLLLDSVCSCSFVGKNVWKKQDGNGSFNKQMTKHYEMKINSNEKDGFFVIKYNYFVESNLTNKDTLIKKIIEAVFIVFLS